jgi:group I intron endonuclease
VYRWTNKINGKTYLGSTANGKKRLNFYFDKGSLLTKKIPIYMALLKYGHENFKFEIIEYCKPKEAVILEQIYLDNYDFEYNINIKANSILGYKHTEETLAKMKGRKNFKGKNHSEENKQIRRDLEAKNRKNKQLSNKIQLSNLFKQFSLYGKIFGLANDNHKRIKITDTSNNQSILINSITAACSVLCTSRITLLKYAEDGNLFSYFERDNLNNCLIERKLLITFSPSA